MQCLILHEPLKKDGILLSKEHRLWDQYFTVDWIYEPVLALAYMLHYRYINYTGNVFRDRDNRVIFQEDSWRLLFNPVSIPPRPIHKINYYGSIICYDEQSFKVPGCSILLFTELNLIFLRL